MDKTPVWVIKFNWDAALDKASNTMGVGVIARDANVLVLANMCTTIPHITDPIIAEVVGAWKAVALCYDLRVQQAIIEGDALEIVQAQKKEEPLWCWYGQQIADTRAKLNSLQFWVPTHVNRKANDVSHRLVKVVISQSLNCIGHSDCPVFIQSFVLIEQNLSH